MVVIRDTTIVSANPGALALVGATRDDDVIARDIFDFVAPGWVPAPIPSDASGANGSCWVVPEFITLVRLDGEQVLIELASGSVVHEGGPATRLWLHDLTHDPGRLRQLATGVRCDSGDAVIVVDSEFRVRSFNPAAERLYGWSEAETLGRCLTETIEDLGRERAATAILDRLRRQGCWHGELVHRSRNGPRRVRTAATLLRDRGGCSVGTIWVNRPVEHGPAPQPARRGVRGIDIRRGLERGEFRLHYQPVVPMAGGTRQVGLEALLRWQHPDFGLLPSEAFLGIVEQSGWMAEIGRLGMLEACRQARAWEQSGVDVVLSVNLSASELADPRVADRLAAAMSATALPPGRFWVEVTETDLVADPEQARIRLGGLRRLGARVAIDDFGAGWSSLAYLRRLPIDSVKIAGDLTRQAASGSSAATAMIRSIVATARELDLMVVATGIEDAGQHAALRALGCDLGQGPFFGRPQPAEELFTPAAG
jgi:PAS domain S-box-containing protein